MKQKIASLLEEILQIENIVLETPKNKDFGHYATPVAFSLAKTLRKAPKVIAEDLSSKLNQSELFTKAEPINGYINLTLSNEFLDSTASTSLTNKQDFAKANNQESILLEYVSANPTGPLHIGHARGAVYGDTLYRVGKHLGFDIKSEYYVNDAGSQISMLGLSIYLSIKSQNHEDVTYPEEYYKGEYIDDLAELAKKKFPSELLKDENCINELASWGKDEMLTLIKNNLSEAKIEFDSFISEKEIQPKFNEIFKLLEKNSFKKDDKVWLKSSEFGDERDRVIIREDGRPTYLAGDIVYHHEKYKRNFDHYINIWGADHHGYIPRVRAAINYMGFDEKQLEVILCQMVSLLKDAKPYKMSKRAGNFITMSDVIEEIGSDALRFIFLSKKVDTHLEFDINTLKAQDSSNPVFYINYAHARINQIIDKSEFKENEFETCEITTTNKDALDLLFLALGLEDVLLNAFSSRELQKIHEYLYSLASSFHKFYNKHQIIGSEEEKQLLKIITVVSLSIRTGLSLIGIEAKTKMYKEKND
ncbi:MAG: Arginyl-tRNA synthetase (EC [uncultured Campylobacterales bacterium]|uniref:Arginine--tRNA ligase n=1 Tax=uncultured Campylobacterales bacterium TaxID=352960 RepID=A0A6S6SD45_9BACT|nr:MAG: Arginyl-tRNA synthetase (EC [uncultured Campylobacterales bacterium]